MCVYTQHKEYKKQSLALWELEKKTTIYAYEIKGENFFFEKIYFLILLLGIRYMHGDMCIL